MRSLWFTKADYGGRSQWINEGTVMNTFSESESER